MMQQVATNRKSQYKPHIRLLDAERGLYTVQSERYGPHLLYAVDVVKVTCECEAGQRQFKGVKQYGGTCKHMEICRQYHTHRLSQLAGRPAQPPTPSAAPAFQGVPASMAWS